MSRRPFRECSQQVLLIGQETLSMTFLGSNTWTTQAILRDKKQARVKKWIDPKKVLQRSLTVRGLWGTFGGLIFRGFWAVSYFFRGGFGGPAGEWRGGWRGISEAYFWRGAVFWRVGWPGNVA